MVTIRSIQASDAERYLELCKRLDRETKFMLLEPGERTRTVAEQRQWIEGLVARDNHVVLVAESGGRLVGLLAALGGGYRRDRHCVNVVVGVLQAFTGQGLGTRLFEALERWAVRHGIRRLELTVMVHNARALALYRKVGFQIEGTRQCSLRVDGEWVDEYAMARLLPG